MDRKGRKEYDNGDGDGDDKSPTPETHDEVQHRLAGFSISQETHNMEDPTPSDSKYANKPQEHGPGQEQQQQARVNDESEAEDESSRTFRINTLRRDSDEPDDDEEQEESRNIEPDELKNILFNFDTPREIDLRVKIKGDFNVTILA